MLYIKNEVCLNKALTDDTKQSTINPMHLLYNNYIMTRGFKKVLDILLPRTCILKDRIDDSFLLEAKSNTFILDAKEHNSKLIQKGISLF